MYGPVIFAVIQVLELFTEQTQTAVWQFVCKSAVYIPLRNVLTGTTSLQLQVDRDPFLGVK
jgi:hypothetical protein